MKKMQLIKYILNNLSEKAMIYKSSYILLNPVVEIAGGFCFEGSATKGDFYVSYFNQPLYIVHDYLHLTFGDRLADSKNHSCFNLEDINEVEVQDLLTVMNNKIQFLKELSDPIKFYSYYKSRHQGNLRIREAVIYTSFWLSLPTAYDELNDFLASFSSEDLSILWRKDLRDKLIQLKEHPQPKVLLEQWKQETLSNLKLNSSAN